MRRYSWPEGHWDWPIKVTHKHGLRCGDMMFVGGQVDLDSTGTVLHPGDRATQVRAAIGHIDTVLCDLGANLTHLVKLQAFYVLEPHITEMAIRDLIGAALPPESQIAITLIPLPFLGYPGMMIEIEAIAMLAENGTALPRHISHPPGLIALPAPLVHALQCEGMIFISGQSPRDADNAITAPGDIVAQSARIMDRVSAILTSLGADLADIVKINRWYVGHGALNDWKRAALEVASRFHEPGPAATGIPLPCYPDPTQQIMIDGIAMRDATGNTLAKQRVWPLGHWDWPVHLPYQHGIKCGNMVFIGGHVALTSEGVVIDPGAMAAQTHTSLDHIHRVLAEFGLGMDAVVKVLALYSAAGRPEELHTNLSIRSAAFTEPGPTTTGIPLPRLAYPGMMIEIEMIAMVPA
jgi:enamine deaminase RidA (YjgF/YER057c/UK114 family)